MTDLLKDGDTWKTLDGLIVRRPTKRLGLIIHRQRYRYRGENRYSRGFYLEKMVNGVIVNFPLGTDALAAAKRADEIGAFLALPGNTLEQARRIYDPRGLARREHFASIAEVFKVHEENVRTLGISAASAKGYRYALVMIMRYVEAWEKRREPHRQAGRKLDWSPWTQQPTTVLTAKQLLDFKAAMLADLEDEEDILTAKISADSFTRQARAVFSEDALRLYGHLKIPLPDLTEWMSVRLFEAKRFFELPPVSVIKSVFDGVAELKATDLNAWRAFIICMHIGLRKAEASALRWDWVESVDGKPRLALREAGAFRPKHGTGRRVVIEPWVWAELEDSRESVDTVIIGNDTERNERVFLRLNAWLQKHGVTAEKPSHELRKCWVSYIAKTQGMLSAQKMAGHKDPKTTATHYADNLLADELLPYWQKAG